MGPLRTAARANADRVLGDAVPAAQREEMARLVTRLVTGLVRAGAGEREALRRLFRGLVGIARDLVPVAPLRPGRDQAALLARFDLGKPSSFYPPILDGVRLGMSREELEKARPQARAAGGGSITFRSRRRARLVERIPGHGPVVRIEYRLYEGRLDECSLDTRFTRAWPALAAKAIAKWGPPRRSSRSWYWSHEEGRVRLRRPRYADPGVVRLRLYRRLRRGRRRDVPSRSYRPYSRGLIARPRLGRARWGADLKIREVQRNRFTISRSSFARLYAEPMRLARQARVVPYYRAGRYAGIKLFSIRPASVYRRLGLRNGDVVTRLAGSSLSGPERLFEVLRRLEKKRKFAAEVRRRGRRLVLHYEIVR